MKTFIDVHGVVHGCMQVTDNWWICWCYTSNLDPAIRPVQLSERAPTCLVCVAAIDLQYSRHQL